MFTCYFWRYVTILRKDKIKLSPFLTKFRIFKPLIWDYSTFKTLPSTLRRQYNVSFFQSVTVPLKKFFKPLEFCCGHIFFILLEQWKMLAFQSAITASRCWIIGEHGNEILIIMPLPFILKQQLERCCSRWKKGWFS